LRRVGLFDEAREAMSRGDALGSRRPDWRYPSPRWLRDCEQLAEIAPRLDELVAGAQPAGGNDERLLASRALSFLGRYHDSVRLVEAALAADPKLAERPWALHRARAVASALLASVAPPGKSGPDDARRAELHGKALAWLAQEVEQGRRLLVSPRPTDVQQGRLLLNLIARERQSGPLQGPAVLASLPPSERARFEALWNEAQRLSRLAQ
jgi:hypothetical protein